MKKSWDKTKTLSKELMKMINQAVTVIKISIRN